LDMVTVNFAACDLGGWLQTDLGLDLDLSLTKCNLSIYSNENHDIAIAMSPSRADPVLPWLGVFKCLIQCYCTGWEYLYI